MLLQPNQTVGSKVSSIDPAKVGLHTPASLEHPAARRPRLLRFDSQKETAKPAQLRLSSVQDSLHEPKEDLHCAHNHLESSSDAEVGHCALLNVLRAFSETTPITSDSHWQC